MRYQIDYDGSEVPAETQLISNLDSTLKELFEQFSWKVKIYEKKGAKYIIDLENSIINKTLNLNVFVGKIRDEARNDREKKIQLNGLDPRVLEEGRTNVILGVYCKEQKDALKDLVFAGWPIDPTTNYPSNPSIRSINTDFIQQAKIFGFVRNQTTSICYFRPEFIYFYIENLSTLSNVEIESINIRGEVFLSNIDEPHQKIIYGAPGTGKSYELESQVNAHFTPKNSTRVTFHPSYSYQQFIGSYKPTPIYKEIPDTEKLYGVDGKLSTNQREPIIDYTFVPGPFLILLINALKSKDENFVLIIEEINRASVASVFGDVFQLLDRNKNGESEYAIQFNTDISNYLISEGIADVNVRLPQNFFIWATMNSADQGVMPLDSAFKRRWSFEYLPLDEKESVVNSLNIDFQGKKYNWNSFRTTLNEELKRLSVAEDKLIGPFFMKENELEDDNAIKNKLLMYLRDDIVRHKPESLFIKKTFSDIIKDYDENKDIFKKLNSDNMSPLDNPVLEDDQLEEEN